MSHTSPGGKPPTIVVAGILIEKQRVLLTQRKVGAHLAGAWEFPGGKLEPGEDPRSALMRELREEIGIEVSVGAPLEVSYFAYPEKSVLLLFFLVSRSPGSAEPRALDVADWRWAERADLRDEEFPAADVPVLVAVRELLVAIAPPRAT